MRNGLAGSRRTFLKTTTGVLGSSLLGPGALAAEGSGATPTALPSNWLWMRPGTRRSDEDWKRLLAKCKASGIDAVVPEVYNGSVAFFEHLNPLVETRANVLERMIPLAHEEGVEVHAWMWTVPCNNANVLRAHGDWYAVNRAGDRADTKPAYVPYYRFLCPRNSEARSYIKSTVESLSGIPGLDGVHLDYVRLPDVILAKGLWRKYGITQDREYPQYDYCYCDDCRAEFSKQSGIDPLTDLEDPSTNQEWFEFRCDGVSELVRDVLVPVARGASKTVTAAVFPNWQYVRQAWHTWGLDAYLPMLYHTFYEEDLDWIGDQTRAAIDRLTSPAAVYPGLFVPALSPAELGAAIGKGRTAGGAGVALFDQGSLREEHWAVLAKTLPQAK